MFAHAYERKALKTLAPSPPTMTTLRILLVSEWFPPEVKGGGERSAELIARNLIRAGHEVHVLTTEVEKSYELKGGVLHRTLNTGSHLSIGGNIKRMLSFPRQVRAEVARLHAKHTFHIIHYLNAVSILGSFKGARQAATINSYVTLCPKGNRFYKEKEACDGCNAMKFAWCFMNSSYIGIAKNPWWFRYNPLLMFLPYFNYRRFQKALKNVTPIAASTAVAEQLHNLGFDNAVTIPHFPAKTEGKAQSNALKKETGKLQLLYVGSLEKQKGIDTLLEAYASLDEKVRSKTNLTIAGDGSLRKELEKREVKGIQFLGKVQHDKVIELMQKSDLIIIPSALPEPLSRVLLEAVSLGKPVLATAIGGNTDIVQEGIGGFLIPPQSMEALKVRLSELIQGKREELETAGRKGKERYDREFSAKEVLKKLLSFYGNQPLS